jgi:hypothetical protein
VLFRSYVSNKATICSYNYGVYNASYERYWHKGFFKGVIGNMTKKDDQSSLLTKNKIVQNEKIKENAMKV